MHQFVMSSGGWTALAACVTAGVALVAAVIGGRQLAEARTLREEQAQPYVVVFPDEAGGDPRHIDLVVKNFGKTAATDVRMKFSSELHSAALQDHSPVKIPAVIPTLVPGQEWRTFWDFCPARAKAPDLPSIYSATVDFKDSHGERSFTATFEINWDALQARGFTTAHTTTDTARALREIKDLLRKWNESTGALSVIVRDGDKQDQRNRDEWEYHQAEHER